MAKGFLGVLEKAGLVSVEDDAPTQPTTLAAPPPPLWTGTDAVPHNVAPAPAGDPALVAKLDTSSREQLSAAVAGAGAQIAAEFSIIVDTLRESIPDEAKLYAAAFKLLTKKGFSPAALASDFDKCIGVLEAKARDFESELKQQFDAHVGAKQQFIANGNTQAESLRAQLTKLEGDIAKAKSAVADEQSHLELVRSRFAMAYESLRSVLQAQRAKCAQYGENP